MWEISAWSLFLSWIRKYLKTLQNKKYSTKQPKDAACGNLILNIQAIFQSREGMQYLFAEHCNCCIRKKVLCICWVRKTQTVVYSECCVLVFCVFLCRSVCLFLYGLFCHGTLKFNTCLHVYIVYNILSLYIYSIYIW